MPAAKRRRRRLLFVLIGLVLVSLAGFYGYFLFGGDRIARFRTNLDRTDPGWRMEEIWAKYERTIPLEEKNPLVAALAAGTAVPAGIFNWTTQADALPEVLRNSQSPFVSVEPKVLESAKVKLDEFRPALDLAHKLRAERALGGSRTALALDGIGTLVPHIDTITRLQYLLKFEGDYAAQADDPDRAMNAANCLVQSGRALGDEPFTVSYLVRQRSTLFALEVAERTLGRCEVRTELLQELLDRLADELTTPPYFEYLRMERASIDRMYQNFAEGKDSVAAMATRYGLAVPGSVTMQTLYFATQRSQEHYEFLVWLTELVAIAKLPEPERLARYKSLSPPTGPKSVVAKLVVGLSGPNFGIEEDLARAARIRCAIAALQCEQLRMRSKQWPAKLEELPEVPLDPFTGKPLLLKRTDRGIVIYSVGPDGIDNGGTFVDLLRPKEGHDIGFQLLDVDQRAK